MLTQHRGLVAQLGRGEDSGHGHIHAPDVVDARKELCGRQGVPAQCEEIVVAADSFHAQYLLVDAPGAVGAERFVTLLLREPFDYTQWQRQLWPDLSVDDLSKAAMASRDVGESQTDPGA